MMIKTVMVTSGRMEGVEGLYEGNDETTDNDNGEERIDGQEKGEKKNSDVSIEGKVQ